MFIHVLHGTVYSVKNPGFCKGLTKTTRVTSYDPWDDPTWIEWDICGI